MEPRHGVFAGAPYQSGGKTGTAQAVGIAAGARYNAAKMEERRRDHALYMAYAPADDPKIALAVIVENAGFGAAYAAPIARRVFDYWLLGQYPSEEDMAAVRIGQASAPIGNAARGGGHAPGLAVFPEHAGRKRKRRWDCQRLFCRATVVITALLSSPGSSGKPSCRPALE